MKIPSSFPKVSALFVLALSVAATSSSAVLLVGWDDWDSYSSVGATFSPDQGIVGVTAGLSVGSNRRATSWGSTSGEFGSVAGASTDPGALILSNSNNALTATLTLTNDTGLDLELTAIHFDFAPRTNALSQAGPRNFDLSYHSGDLGTGPVAIGSESNLPIWITNSTTNAFSAYPGYDYNLSPALSNITLANGQHATFRLVFSNFGSSDVGSILDNVAVTGTVIPEPSNYAMCLGGLAVLALIIRRFRGQVRSNRAC